MPVLDERINARDVELLLQFLTAPYLRIPLVLHFFADEGRLHALGNPVMQGFLGGVPNGRN